MGHQTYIVVAALLLACCASGSWRVQASDPELTTDFAVPAGVNVSTLDGNFFTSTTLRSVSVNQGNFATVTLISVDVFPALQGLGVSSALVQFPPGAVNAPHTHPRGSEVLYIVEGTLDVGLLDTTNKLFTQTLQAGDLFVFPKGLVHFEINNGKDRTVKAVAAFSSSNPGRVTVSNALFKSGVANDVLAKSFGVDSYTIDQLEQALVN